MTTKKNARRVLKSISWFLLLGSVSLIAIFFIWHILWITSGSNKWELEIDRNGIQVYSLKSPGSNNKKFKGVVRYENYSLSHFVAAMVDDNNLKNCIEWIPTCIDFKSVEKFDTKKLSDANLLVMETFFPFSPREMLVKGHVYQDKETKEVYIEYLAAPNKLPPNDCCVRVTHMHNSWRYIPLGNGNVHVEHIQDFDMGGFFPDILLNLAGVDEVYKFLSHDLPGLLDKDEYRKARFDFIDEPMMEEDLATDL